MKKYSKFLIKLLGIFTMESENNTFKETLILLWNLIIGLALLIILYKVL